MSCGEIRSRYVRANGVKTHYSEAGGNGPAIVAVHGGGHGSSGFAGIGTLMVLLADEFRIIAPDSIGGYGMTDPEAPAPLGLLSRTTHLADFLDSICLDSFVLIGNSHGAFTAVHYALHHPDRIRKLVLIASAVISRSMGVPQEPTPAMKALGAYDGTRDAMVRLLRGLVVDHSRLTDELVNARQASATRPGAMEAMARFNRATTATASDLVLSLQLDLTVSLPILTKAIPTMLIWGEQDAIALPESGRGVEAKLPDAEFHWVKSAGHQVQTDQPDLVARLVREFVNRR